MGFGAGSICTVAWGLSARYVFAGVFLCIQPGAQPRACPGPFTPAAEWATRWGAIAIGSTATGGFFGASTNMRSKSQAEQAAAEKCKNTGGGDVCRAYAYYNQCAVVAWGIKSYTLQTAETVDIATDLAMRDCSAKTQDCQLFYSACSLPVRVR